MTLQRFRERASEVVTSKMATWTYIFTFLLGMAVYMLINNELGKHAWDPYPYILLNLALSLLAAIQSSLIMMSQNAQLRRERIRDDRLEKKEADDRQHLITMGEANLAIVEELRRRSIDETTKT